MKRLLFVVALCSACSATERKFVEAGLSVTVKETDLSERRNPYPWVSGCFTEIIITTADGVPIPESFNVTLMHRDNAGKIRSQSQTASNGAAIPNRVNQDARTMFWTDRCSGLSVTIQPVSAAVVFGL